MRTVTLIAVQVALATALAEAQDTNLRSKLRSNETFRAARRRPPVHFRQASPRSTRRSANGLGLPTDSNPPKLESRREKASYDVLVIKSVELPSEN